VEDPFSDSHLQEGNENKHIFLFFMIHIGRYEKEEEKKAAKELNCIAQS
jgi:hypothetical protein